MARNDDYEARPKPDVYLALLVLTFVGMLVATAIMWLENAALKPG
jgi:hypothetical protein